MQNTDLFLAFASAASMLTDAEITAGKRWYPDANRMARQLARRYDVTVMQASGVIAAFSPRCSWSDNVKRAARYLAGTRDSGGFKSVLKKCASILKAKTEKAVMRILSGAKTVRFFHNILHPVTSMMGTIDSWMIKIPDVEYGQLKLKMGHARTLYERMESVMQDVARAFGMTTAQMQAALWVAVRGSAA